MGEGGIEAKKEFSGGSNLEDLVLVGGGGVSIQACSSLLNPSSLSHADSNICCNTKMFQ